MAVVVPFPAVRRRRQLRKTAAYMATLADRHADAHLRQQVRRLAAGLTRKGVEPAAIEAECRAYETAIRVEVWRLLRASGDAA